MTVTPEPGRFRPVILAVDDDPDGLKRVELEPRKRYEADYRVLCEGSAEGALRRLRDLRAEGVALVLADERMPEIRGTELLTRARQLLHPTAKRLLLVDPMDAVAPWPCLCPRWRPLSIRFCRSSEV